jgi:hypothetical protein
MSASRSRQNSFGGDDSNDGDTDTQKLPKGLVLIGIIGVKDQIRCVCVCVCVGFHVLVLMHVYLHECMRNQYH